METLANEISALSPKRLKLLEQLMAQEGIEPASLPIFAAKAKNWLPLSFAQKTLWFLDHLGAGSAYNMHLAVAFSGLLDIDALERTLEKLIHRQESLRTRFPTVEGKPVAVTDSARKPLIPVVDLSELGETTRHRLKNDWSQRERRHPFDLANKSLWRVFLARLTENQHLLFFTIHHIITDVWSMGVMINEIAAFYRAEVCGETAGLPPLTIQYSDFANWQHRQLTGKPFRPHVAYWKAQFQGGIPPMNWPPNRPEDSNRTWRGSTVQGHFSEKICNHLKSLSRETESTVFMTLMTVLLVQIHGESGSEDVTVGTDVAGRTLKETEHLLGFFINQLPLRVNLSGNPNFKQLMRRVRAVTLKAYAHQDMPFDRLIEMLNPQRTSGRNPLFGTKLILQNTPKTRFDLPGLGLQLLPEKPEVAHADVILYCEETEQGMSLTLEYSTDLFTENQAKRLLAQYQALTAAALTHPEASLKDLVGGQRRKERKNKMKRNRAKAKSGLKQFLQEKTPSLNLATNALVKTDYLGDCPQKPLVVSPAVPDVDPADWVASNRGWVQQQLTAHGAILFRGFRVFGDEDFEGFCRAAGGHLMDYNQGSTPRTKVKGKVYTSTEYPKNQSIPLHNEMSYTRTWPDWLWFFCHTPPTKGGETPLGDSQRIFEEIDPAIRNRFIEKGVLYVRNFGEELDLSWQQCFRTEDRTQVENYCREAGITFRWQGEKGLQTRQVCQAAVTHPESQKMVWFNQAHLFHISNLDAEIAESLLAIYGEEQLPRNAYYGDGSPIEASILAEIRKVYQSCQFSFPWQRGDMMLVDNLLCAHGRNPFEGPRRVVVTMVQHQTDSQ